MLKSRLACITGMCILSSSSLGTAAEFEKSGDAEYDTYYVSKTLAEIPSSELGRSGIDEFSGITRNVKGESPFDRMSVHCIAHWTAIRNKPFTQNGSCVETDEDGDNILTTFDGGTHVMVGGSGKYRGIIGKASFTVTPLHETVAGRQAVIVNHKVHWDLQ